MEVTLKRGQSAVDRKPLPERCACGASLHLMYKSSGDVWEVRRICPDCGRVDGLGYVEEPPTITK